MLGPLHFSAAAEGNRRAVNSQFLYCQFPVTKKLLDDEVTTTLCCVTSDSVEVGPYYIYASYISYIIDVEQ